MCSQPRYARAKSNLVLSIRAPHSIARYNMFGEVSSQRRWGEESEQDPAKSAFPPSRDVRSLAPGICLVQPRRRESHNTAASTANGKVDCCAHRRWRRNRESCLVGPVLLLSPQSWTRQYLLPDKALLHSSALQAKNANHLPLQSSSWAPAPPLEQPNSQ